MHVRQLTLRGAEWSISTVELQIGRCIRHPVRLGAAFRKEPGRLCRL